MVDPRGRAEHYQRYFYSVAAYRNGEGLASHCRLLGQNVRCLALGRDDAPGAEFIIISHLKRKIRGSLHNCPILRHFHLCFVCIFLSLSTRIFLHRYATYRLSLRAARYSI